MTKTIDKQYKAKFNKYTLLYFNKRFFWFIYTFRTVFISRYKTNVVLPFRGSVYDGFSWQHCRLAARHPAVPDPAITTPFCQFRHLKRPILEL